MQGRVRTRASLGKRALGHTLIHGLVLLAIAVSALTAFVPAAAVQIAAARRAMQGENQQGVAAPDGGGLPTFAPSDATFPR